MAWFSFNCAEHGKFTLSLDKRQAQAKCPKCFVDSYAIIGLGTTTIVERLDNGAMGRAIERLHNIEDIMEERADKHTEQFEEQFGKTDEEQE